MSVQMSGRDSACVTFMPLLRMVRGYRSAGFAVLEEAYYATHCRRCGAGERSMCVLRPAIDLGQAGCRILVANYPAMWHCYRQETGNGPA